MNRNETEVQKTSGAGPARAEPRERETILIPEADILQTPDAVVLKVNLPGTAPDAAEVRAENGILTLESEARVDAPEGYRLAAQEYGVCRYRRAFEMSDELDPDGIKARMKNGVLTVAIPRKAESAGKKIKITAE